MTRFDSPAPSLPLRLVHWMVLLGLVLLVALPARRASAEPMRLEALPPDLRPWVPWVLHDLGTRTCPLLRDTAVCVWPGTLELELDEQGGRFRHWVYTDREEMVALPGSVEAWPQEVELGRRPAVVLEVDGRPMVRVSEGEHELSGRFLWTRLPERIAVHPHVAQIRLTVGGALVTDPHRGEDGSVWLASDAVRAQEAERLELEVYRRWADGVPVRLTTRLAFRVGGRARELGLSGVLPSSARALSVSSELPVRLEASGELTVQLRPGQHAVEIEAVVPAEVTQIVVPEPKGPWVDQEIWVFAPDNRLRQVDLKGGSGIDPQRTNLPANWKSLRAFSLAPGEQLSIETLRRGEPEPPPNRITLQRDMWLDLDGGGYTVRDRFGGKMHREHRLALMAGSLGHAVAHGEDQLVVLTEQGHSAVELRRSDVDLQAEWRLTGRGPWLPAVGWSEDVEELGATLHLPPGWELLGASGVDELSESWVSDWNLFDVFFVLVVALAVARLFGLPWGVLALIGLTLSHRQPDAPYYLWATLLLFVGMLSVIPAGWVRRVVRAGWWLTAIALVVSFVTFAVGQAQRALFPASIAEYPVFSSAMNMEQKPAYYESEDLDLPPERDDGMSTDAEEEVRGRLEQSIGKAGGGYSRSTSPAPQKRKSATEKKLEQDPHAVIQTGPGVPTWGWRTWHLGWSGPVERSHELRLWLLAPWQSTLVALLRILVLGALLWAVLRRVPPASPLSSGGSGAEGAGGLGRKLWRRKSRAAAAGAGVLVSLSLPAPVAQAQEPSEKLLTELRDRIIEDRDCKEQCVSVSRLDIDAQERTLRIEAEVHVAAPASYQLPGPARSLSFTSVQVNGRPSSALLRWTDGFFHLRLDRGRHRVVLIAPLVRDELVLSLGTAPKRVGATARGWQVDGVQDDGRVEGSLTLTRLPDEAGNASEGAIGSSDLPPWFEVRRTLFLGVTWSVETVVRRVSSAGTPRVVRYALLPGEQVTSSGVTVEQREAVLFFDRDAEEITFESALEVQPQLQLVAAKDKPWSEHWSLDCGVLWRCDLSGIAPYEHESADSNDGGATRWLPKFRPWPGETVAIATRRSEPAPGASVTIDSAMLTFEPGTRLTRGTLELRVRNSAGGTQYVDLPPTARSIELLVDGSAQPTKIEKNNRVAVALTPGTNAVRLSWQQPEGLSARWQAPVVRVAGGAVNTNVRVQLPDRWLLLAQGPSWGPAILFWPYLLLIAMFGVVLGRLPRSPLRGWQWMLLGLGLATVPAFVAVLVASWFFVLAYRDRYLPPKPTAYNLVQLSLLGWTALFLGCLVGTVYRGLVVRPDMDVVGNGSTNSQLSWYVDRIADQLPTPAIVSAPLWVWRLVMLLWALWLAVSLLRWLRWGWTRFSEGGAFRPMSRSARQAALGASGGQAIVSEPIEPIEPSPAEPLASPPGEEANDDGHDDSDENAPDDKSSSDKP